MLSSFASCGDWRFLFLFFFFGGEGGRCPMPRAPHFTPSISVVAGLFRFFLSTRRTQGFERVPVQVPDQDRQQRPLDHCDPRQGHKRVPVTHPHPSSAARHSSRSSREQQQRYHQPYELTSVSARPNPAISLSGLGAPHPSLPIPSSPPRGREIKFQ